MLYKRTYIVTILKILKIPEIREMAVKHRLLNSSPPRDTLNL